MKNELIAVSFGTSHPDTRERSIGAVENALQEAFPGYRFQRAFTSGIIRKILRERDGLTVPDPAEALRQAAASGAENVLVQPTHLMDGREYARIKEAAAACRDCFRELRLGAPLLASRRDFEELIAVLAESTAYYIDGETAVCWMGHGTDVEANRVYGRLQEMFHAAGHTDHFVGTVEGVPTLEETAALVTGDPRYKRAVLLPLMTVAGDHAVNDMAGDGSDSWKSMFLRAGLRTECVLKGLGEYPGVREMYVRHAREAREIRRTALPEGGKEG